jgi:hypothetical protein
MRVLPCRSHFLVIAEVQVPLVINDVQVPLLVITDVQVPLLVIDKVQALLVIGCLCRSSKCGSFTCVLGCLVASFQVYYDYFTVNSIENSTIKSISQTYKVQPP